jgi:hypothetical protein
MKAGLPPSGLSTATQSPSSSVNTVRRASIVPPHPSLNENLPKKRILQVSLSVNPKLKISLQIRH